MKNFPQALKTYIHSNHQIKTYKMCMYVDQPTRSMLGVIVDLETNEELLTESCKYSKNPICFYEINYIGPNQKLKRAVNLKTIEDCFEDFERIVSSIKKHQLANYEETNFKQLISMINYYDLKYPKFNLVSNYAKKGYDSYKNMPNLVKSYKKHYVFLENL